MILRTPREIVLMMARELDPQESAPEDYEYIHEWVPEHSCGGAGDPTCAACWMHDFDHCLAAHDAEVRAAVVAEEPEWEYGTEYDIDAHESVFTATHSEEMARKWVADSPHDTGLVRRRKAGPWTPVPVEQGDDDA